MSFRGGAPNKRTSPPFLVQSIAFSTNFPPPTATMERSTPLPLVAFKIFSLMFSFPGSTRIVAPILSAALSRCSITSLEIIDPAP